MNVRNFVASTLLAAVLLIVVVVPLSTQQGNGSYDPWLDYNGDGRIDANDLQSLGKTYGTSGETTRNVNVTNPQLSVVPYPSTDVLVWWQIPLAPSTKKPTYEYKAGGFGKLHVLVATEGLGLSESLTLQTYAALYNHTEDACYPVVVCSIGLNSTVTEAGFTIPVPSEFFYFYVTTSPTTECTISLSFRLTVA